jgi:Na+/H+ antiporter NhaD/arsenite permease-like protein
MDQLRPSFHGVATALCDGMDCAYSTGPSPVVFYAGLFVCIDVAYNVFERDLLAHADATQVSERKRHIARRRSLVVLAIFTTATLIAFVAPRVGFGLICCGLILHVRPEVPAGRTKAQ